MHINRLFFFMLLGTSLYAQDTTSQDASVQKMPSQKLKDQQKRDDKKGVKKLRSKKRQEKVNKAVQAVHGGLTQLQNQMAQLHAATLKAAGTVQTAQQMAAASVTQPPTQAAASQQQAQAAMKLVLPDIAKVKKDIKNAGKKAQEVSLQAQQMQKTITQHAPADMEIAQHASTVAQQVAQTHAAVSQAASAAQTAAQQVKAAATTPLTPLSSQKVVALHDTAHAATQNLHQTVQGAKTNTDAALAEHQEVAKRLNVRASGGDDFPCAGSDADCIKFIASVGVAGVLTPVTIATFVKNSTIKSFLAQQTRDKLEAMFTSLEDDRVTALSTYFRGIRNIDINAYCQFIEKGDPSAVNEFLGGKLYQDELRSRVAAWRRGAIYSQIAKDYNKLNGGNISADEVQRNMQNKVKELADSDLFDIQKFELPYYKFQYSFAVTSELKELGVTGENVSAETLQNYLKPQTMSNLLDVPAGALAGDVRIWFIKNKATIDQIFELFPGNSVLEVIRDLPKYGRLENIQIPDDLSAILSKTEWNQLSPGAKAALKNFIGKGDVKFLERFKFADQKLAVRDLLKNMEGGELKNTSTQAIQQRLKEMGYADSEIYEGVVPLYIDNQLAFTRGARAISAYLKEHEGQAITRDMLKGQVPENAMENQAFRDQVYPQYVNDVWKTSSGADALEGREIMEATRGMEVPEESELGNFVRILVELFF